MPVIRLKVPKANTGPAMAAEPPKAVDASETAEIPGPEAAGPAREFNKAVDATETGNPTHLLDSTHLRDSSEVPRPILKSISFDFQDFGHHYHNTPTHRRRVSVNKYRPILPFRPIEMANTRSKTSKANNANTANAANMAHNAGLGSASHSNANMENMAYDDGAMAGDTDVDMAESDAEKAGMGLYSMKGEAEFGAEFPHLNTDLPFTPVDIDLLPDFKVERISRVVTVSGRMLGVVGQLYPLATFCVVRVPAPKNPTLRLSGGGMAKFSALLPPAVAEQQQYMICLRMRDWPSGGVAAFPDTRENKAALEEVEATFDKMEHEVWVRRPVKPSGGRAERVLKVIRGYEGANGAASNRATERWFRRNSGKPDGDAVGNRIMAQFAFADPRHEGGEMVEEKEGEEEEGGEEEVVEQEEESEEEEVAPAKKGRATGRGKGKGKA
ncbi:hypothetical protein B0T25DRAFT_633873 [Lasiosphaeria hispida]|uniref:Uncharacterized protein n=1 Tax=Lasiosphaeria hispida TaxID=260671 RepID=A0AAJ0HB58_9PEZI|nr:hypothetical protein B0T25DRAFT_633873 [Lasiosphaeria hispida]